MAFMLLGPSEKMTEVVQISKTEGCTIELVTVKERNMLIDPLTLMFHKLPADVRSHSIRAAVVAKLLAEQAETLPKGMNMAVFSHTVWLGCLYHHLGAVSRKNKRQLPVLTEKIIKENMLNALAGHKVDEYMMLDIARHCFERADGSGYPDKLSGRDLSLAARLVGFACALDGMEQHENGDAQVASLLESGCCLFGAEVMTCFEGTRDEIFDLYLRHRQACLCPAGRVGFKNSSERKRDI